MHPSARHTGRPGRRQPVWGYTMTGRHPLDSTRLIEDALGDEAVPFDLCAKHDRLVCTGALTQRDAHGILCDVHSAHLFVAMEASASSPVIAVDETLTAPKLREPTPNDLSQIEREVDAWAALPRNEQRERLGMDIVDPALHSVWAPYINAFSSLIAEALHPDGAANPSAFRKLLCLSRGFNPGAGSVHQARLVVANQIVNTMAAAPPPSEQHAATSESTAGPSALPVLPENRQPPTRRRFCIRNLEQHESDDLLREALRLSEELGLRSRTIGVRLGSRVGDGNIDAGTIRSWLSVARTMRASGLI